MKHAKDNCIGLILCGGKSSRMGQDKGLMKTSDNLTWAAHLEKVLIDTGIERVFLSVGQHNHAAYLPHFAAQQLIVDQQLPTIPSALVGILSAYQQLKTQFKHFSILVFACDLQLIDITIVKLLLDALQDPSHSIHVLADDHFIQPLAGIYTDKALEKLLEMSQNNAFSNCSMRYFIRQLSTNILLLDKSKQAQLMNFNSPDDLTTT